MLRLNIVSDLHLEFNQIVPRNETQADVLILSGDVCTAMPFKRSEASPYYAKAQRFRQFFRDCADQYEYVVYVMGNHEHYDGKMSTTAQILRDNLPEKVWLLDRETVIIDGITFIGSTLWTDMGNGNPVSIHLVENGLNDYRCIQSAHGYHKLRGTETIVHHKRDLAFIDQNAQGRTVVVGHHAPSWQSIHPQYQTGKYSHLNPGYYSELGDFILDHPQIELWTHGHVHNNMDYMIGNTRVFCNPNGYGNENPEFDWNKVVEI